MGKEARANAKKKGLVTGNQEGAAKAAEMERLYTVYEAAEILRLNHRTIRIWMKQGKLNYITIKPGLKDKYRIKQSDLNKILEENNT